MNGFLYWHVVIHHQCTRYIDITCLITYSLALRPSESLDPLITDTHSSLSTAFCRHLLTFYSRRSFPTYSSHLNLVLPLLLLPSGLLSDIFLTILT